MKVHSGDLFYRVIWLLIGISAAGVIAYCYSNGSTLTYADEKQYFAIAQNIATGHGFSYDGSPTAYRPPVWPLFLAVPIAVGLPPAVTSLVPALALLLAAAAAGKIGVDLSGNRFGIIAALAVLLYPLNVYAAGTLYPQAAATAMFLGLWLVASRIEDLDRHSATPGEAATIGILAAAMALTVPTMALTALIVLAWLLYRQTGNRMRFGLIAGFSAVAPVAVWTTRNLLSMQSPVLLSTSSGINLLIGNSEGTTPSNGLAADVSRYREAASDLRLDEIRRNQFFSDRAHDWIFGHPGDAAVLYFGKVVNYFSPYNDPATAGEGGNFEMIVSWVACLALVAAFVYRVYLARKLVLKFQPTEVLFVAIFFVNAPAMALFFTRVRFRQPLDSVFLIEAAVVGAILLIRLFGDRSTKLSTK